MAENPSMMSHVSIGTNDFERAIAFYDKVLATLGCKRMMEHPGAIAYGKQFPEFWVQTPFDEQTATSGLRDYLECVLFRQVSYSGKFPSGNLMVKVVPSSSKELKVRLPLWS
ncbi:MAG: hypothetical protein AAFQ63_17415 [Cyanobacteria bacterium J06621_11]